jgi:TetR/AcrR family transcriptional regulator, regulator of mycofactocin system
MTAERLRDLKRQETRQRLLDAGMGLFAEQGYNRTTTAQIAEAAGVTERTFFRHFPTKTDLVLANWARLAASLDAAMKAQPEGTAPMEVVRVGVLAFGDLLTRTVEQEPAPTMTVYAGQLPVLAMLEVVLALESSIAVELGRRLGVSDEDLAVRMVANTSIGVLRACGRAYTIGDRTVALATKISEGIDSLAPLFELLTTPANKP